MIEDRDELISQFITLSRQYVDTGETDRELYNHFDADLEWDEIAWIEQNGRVIAFGDWSWISTQDDMHKADNGVITTGPVLYIMNVVVLERRLIWKLRALAPKSNWVVFRHNDRIRSPKGWPHETSQMAVA